MPTKLDERETETVAFTEVPKEQVDVLEQLLDPKVQASLTVLVDNLPKLAELTTILTKSYDLVQSLTSDKVLYDDMASSFQEMAKPVETKVKQYAATAIEANDRAEAETDASAIGLFGILRMLKDPQVQKTLRFAQAYLDIQAEKGKEK